MGWIECALFKSHHSISRWVGHGGMDAALRALHQGNVDISVLLEEYMTGGDPHAIHRGIHGMGDRGGKPSNSRDHHHMDRGYRVAG